MTKNNSIQFITLHPDGSLLCEKSIKRSDIRKCPWIILKPEHYRENGSCRCNDPEHLEMKEWGYTWNGSFWEGPDE